MRLRLDTPAVALAAFAACVLGLTIDTRVLYPDGGPLCALLASFLIFGFMLYIGTCIFAPTRADH